MERTELVYKKAKGISPFSYVVVGEWLYFCNYFLPILFRYHFKEQRTERVAMFDKGWLNQSSIRIYNYQDELWLLPFMASNIICFHINTREVEYYDIPLEIKSKAFPFVGMFFGGGKAYIVPHGNNRILLEIDLQTHAILEVCLLENKQKNEDMRFNGVVRYHNDLYLAEISKNNLVSFNLNNREIKHIHLAGQKLDELLPIEIGGNIYFFPVTIKGNENLLMYDINTNEWMRKEYPIKSLSKGEVCINVAWNEEIWILANKKRKIYRINKDLEIISEVSILNFNEKERSVYISGMSFDSRLFFGGYDEAPLIQVKDGDIHILDICVNKTSLEIYIEIIGQCDICKDIFEKANVGKSIYRNLLSDDK